MSTDETEGTARTAPNGAAGAAPAAPLSAQPLENGPLTRRRKAADGAIEDALKADALVVSSMVKAARNFGAVVTIAQQRPVVVNKRGVPRAVVISARRMAFYESLVTRYARETAITELEEALQALLAGKPRESYARRRRSRRFAAYAPGTATLARRLDEMTRATQEGAE